MLCIFDGVLEDLDVSILNIAKRIRAWVAEDGMGIGGTLLVGAPVDLFALRAPLRACGTEPDGMSHPTAGSVRTSILGVWKYDSLAEVKKNAEKSLTVSRATPRCVGSCVAVSTAIALLLQGKESISRDTRHRLARECQDARRNCDKHLKMAATGAFEDSALDEGLTATQSRLNQLYPQSHGRRVLGHSENAPSYRDGVSQVIHEGGDADTNAAVVGAILGAKFGFANIPAIWVTVFRDANELDARVTRMLETFRICGVNPISA